MFYLVETDPDSRETRVRSRHRTEAGAQRAWKRRRRELESGHGRFVTAGIHVWTAAQVAELEQAKLARLGARIRGESGAAGSWLRTARQARGWTQGETAERLAALLGTNNVRSLVAQLSRWEHGSVPPQPAMLLALRQVLEG
jgi:hypothetical protein